MLKTLAVIAVIAVVVIAGILIYAATKPDSFRVQRTASIKAPPDKIHALIADLKAWPVWSPYEKKDPAMKRSFGAVTAGKGATYAWEGNKDVGQGNMEIVESSPQKVLIKLDFLKPFEAHNMAEFILAPKGVTTNVTWAIYGPSPYMSKVMGTFMDFDKMIGRDFEQGLADLKAAAEK
ncbi:MAG: SRPBCC family protein [Reyranella sp.]|nr:SRPBCC family protein [Reyranella sp.]MBL6653231.1 SRPBCC family protein [Reyranella sp.]